MLNVEQMGLSALYWELISNITQSFELHSFALGPFDFVFVQSVANVFYLCGLTLPF